MDFVPDESAINTELIEVAALGWSCILWGAGLELLIASRLSLVRMTSLA